MEKDPRDFHVGIKGLVFDDAGRLLLLEERDGTWDLPGGRIEHGEDIAEALTREIKEEMGVGITMLDDHPHWAWTEKMSKGGRWMVRLGYRITLASFNFITTEECVGYDFFTADKLQQLGEKIYSQKIISLLADNKH